MFFVCLFFKENNSKSMGFFFPFDHKLIQGQAIKPGSWLVA